MQKKGDKAVKANVNPSKKYKIIVSLCAVGIMILSFLGGFFTKTLVQGNTVNTLAWIVKTVDAYYYDEADGTVKRFGQKEYADALVKGLLDDYSDYYTKSEYSDVIKTSRGNNYGTGISVLKAPENPNDTSIYRVSGNSPAYKAGLRDGDRIEKFTVGGEDTEISTSKQLNEFLTNVGNDEFTIFVDRNGEKLNFKLKKAVFIKSFVYYYDDEKALTFESEGAAKPIKTVNGYDNETGLDENTAYICLTNFDGGAAGQFSEAMAYLKERGKSKLILDLRKNGGGYMDILGSIASHFIDRPSILQPLIAVAKDKNGKSESFFANTGGIFNDEITKITVIADNDTASASECLIGAMLFYGDGRFSIDNLVIEGTKTPATTYGKGIMQTTYVNPFTGEALKLTTAKIFWPDGVTSIHGVGAEATAANSVSIGGGLARALEVLSD